MKHTVTQNVGEDNNSLSSDPSYPPENVHNTVSGILGQWIEKEKKYMHFR
jgi:hypothetical protein